MLILTIRTDNPQAELALYEDGTLIEQTSWQAHRLLAETIHTKIKELLDTHGKSLEELQGIVVFKGPGSFTGLRIGLTVANALAYGGKMHIVGQMGENWQADGIRRLLNNEDDTVVIPEYGSPVHITLPKK